jgi:mannose-6-phosphate isomerase-like protein (cupin superfamily)
MPVYEGNKMSGNKYDKYFVSEPLGKEGFFPRIIVNGARDFDGAEFSFRLHYITEPGILVKEPHAHDFEQFYFFFNGDLGKYREFHAEVEFSLGEEGEMHLITAPTAVHVPAGMIHGPMNFKRIDEPIIFIDTLLSAQYATR